MRTGLRVAALCASVLAQTAPAADFGTQKPKSLGSPSYLALQRLGDPAAIRIDLSRDDLRQAFVVALQGSSAWQEVQGVPAGNVLGILPTGVQITLADSDDQYIVVLADVPHTFQRLPVPTALVAFQTLCNVFTDANYAYNVYFPGTYPHVFGYPPAACEFGFDERP